MCFAALLISGPAVYSGNIFRAGPLTIMTYNGRVSMECIKGRKVRMTDLGQLALEDLDLVEEMGH